ncbi:MAG: hypothetical protein ABEJ60_00670 [Halodesulfurarchaeum sp.]
MRTTRTVFEMGLREYARSPVLLALLVFLPAYFILVFASVMPATPVPVDIAGRGTMTIELSSLTPVLMAPLATALVGGIAGLFMMQSARDVDSRLSLVGVTGRELLLARAGLLTVAALVASLVSLGVLLIVHVPEMVGWFLIATVIVGLMYGGFGALIGLAFNRLAGIYLLMFGPLLDIFLAQSPLAEQSPAIATYLPAHFPMKLVFDAAFTARIDLSNLVWALWYLLLIGLLVGVAFGRILRAE